MPLDLVTIPCLSDNYVYLLHDPVSGETACVDAPVAAPILAALRERGWRLTHILLTHHHADHVEGVEELRAATGARVLGAAADAHRLPPLDLALTTETTFSMGGEVATVIDVSGHTVGHIAFYFPETGVALTGDSLMAAGCGRMFEGNAPMFHASLARLAALPDATLIASGHEYTAANLRFALSLEPGNPALILRAEGVAAARAKGLPTVPSRLSEERATNPYLRVSDPALKARMGLADAPDVVVFAAIRAAKDKF
jgi:hydroxyacylglutathione hydrolase